MNVELRELIGEVDKTQSVLDRLGALYDDARGGDVDRTLEKAVFLTDVMVNFYTCLETVFFRISQFFESALPKDRWHAELLRKMSLNVPGIREAVLTDETVGLLDELRRFRHFKRYYYSMDYDWDRLDYLGGVFDKVRARIPSELNRFRSFLDRLAEP